MSLTNKVAQFDADSNLVNSWAHGNFTHAITTQSGPVSSPAKVIFDAGIKLQAAVDSIQTFTSRGNWAATTSYAIKDLVMVGYTWYVCVVPHTSSAAFVTDTSSKWRVYQGITAGELSAANGATFIGANSFQTQDSVNMAIRTVDSFGVLGVGNDAAVFQAALTEVSTTTKTLYIKSNTRLDLGNATFTLTNSINIIGLGKRGSSTIAWTGTAVTLFNITASASVHFEDIQFLGPYTGAGTLLSPYVSASTGGAIVALSGLAGVSNSFSTFRKCSFVFGYNAIDLQSTIAIDVDGCYFTGFARSGVNVTNTIDEDAGDSTIQGCTFGNAPNAVACINQTSSGGLRVVNNKLNTGQFGYKLQLEGTVGTSNLILVGNSIENAGVAGIGLFRTPGQTATFNNVVINGNQVSLCDNGILMNSEEEFYKIAAVTGNVISAVRDYGIIIDNADTATVVGNVIFGSPGAIAGIVLDGPMDGAEVAHNKIVGFEQDIINLSVAGTVTKDTRTLLTYASGIDGVTTLTETVVATAKVPSGALGSTGALSVSLFGVVSNNARTKVLRARLGGISGPVVFSASVSAVDNVVSSFNIVNATKTQQLTCHNTRHDLVTQYSAPIATTVNTELSQELVFTVEKDDVTDVILFQNIVVQLLA